MVGNYVFKDVEPKILKFWDEKKIYKKAKDKNKGKTKYYFLDGPPYTSGKVHIGTAWNNALLFVNWHPLRSVEEVGGR